MPAKANEVRKKELINKEKIFFIGLPPLKTKEPPPALTLIGAYFKIPENNTHFPRTQTTPVKKAIYLF
ncbi:MAG: hypothetical protein NT096_12160 [Proteobacteria bacterium]|nr:hypothetical protein [Pseudomonadota bacterium]